MLHLSLHAGPLGGAAFNNSLGFVDMAPKQRDLVQDYRFAFFTSKRGPAPLIELAQYPRYSASIWDLAGRAIALHLQEREQAACRRLLEAQHELARDLRDELGMTAPDPLPPARLDLKEQSPAFEPYRLRPAYAVRMCAIFERAPDAFRPVPEVLAKVELECTQKKMGRYTAVFEEPGFDAKRMAFTHAPEVLSHWRLLLAAIGHRLCDVDNLPVRPAPIIPHSTTAPAGSETGEKAVLLGDVVEPCRTWLCKWLQERGDFAALEKGLVSEGLVIEFLTAS